LTPILARKTRLEQVIFNLVANARDAVMRKKEAGPRAVKPAITIRSFYENERVALTVADNGSGIPQDILDEVFEPFFTTKEVGGGMGLGLSISYGIVKDYNGNIDIQSKEGEGTTVKLTFPCA